MKIIVTGDYCEKLRISNKVVQGDHKQLFDEIRPILSTADYSVVNFEFPIINSILKNKEAIPKCGPSLSGHLESVNAIKYAGFNVATIANNHILDQGENNMLYTIGLLKQGGLNVVGGGKNIIEASIPLIVHDKKGESLALINCCEHEFSIATETQAGACPLNPIKQWYTIRKLRHEVDYIVVIVHGGHEHYQLPSPRMKETYRFLIDAGADAVVNHHQHCYSGYEIYCGKPIFYGLGNLLFDHPTQRNSCWNEGLFVELKFSKTTKPLVGLYPYTQCNETPTIKLMQGKQSDNFWKNIEKLNAIISDDNALKDSFERFALKNATSYKAIFEPYSWKPLSSLYWRHLLPSFLTKKKKYSIMNYINCEAHLDRLRYIVSRL